MNTTTKIIGGIALTAAAAFAAVKLLGKKEAPAQPLPPAPVPPPPPAPPKAHKPKPQAPKTDPFMTRSQAIGVILYGINAVQKIEDKHAAASLGGKFAVAVNSMSDSELEGYAKHWQALAKNIEAGNSLNISPILSKEAKESIKRMIDSQKNAVPAEKKEGVVSNTDLKAAVMLNSAMAGPGTIDGLLFTALRSMGSFKAVKNAYWSIYGKELIDTIKSELSDEGYQLALELIKKKP